MENKRGYYGIAFFEPKFEENIGTIIRSANCFYADFISIIGKKYKRTTGDTTLAEKHIPIYEYKNLDDFLEHIPIGCEIIGIEVDGKRNLKNFIHPERAVYVIGSENMSLPKSIKNRLKIDTKYCLNMAVAASIVLFHRNIQIPN